MGPSDIFVLIGAIAGVAAVVVAYLAYRYTRKKDLSDKDMEQFQNMITLALTPIRDDLAKGDTRMAVLETKIEVYWRTVMGNGIDVIHSPDPGRAHVDDLLEKLRNGAITKDELMQLKHLLRQIRNWEPGQPSDFPIKQGEQFAAGGVLAAIEALGDKLYVR